MAKKNLNGKISDICFWFGWSILAYVITAFLFKTDFLSKPYTLSNTFDLIKDSLTLAAAFLAPIAAFVLFSDWRIQHQIISNIEQSRLFSKEFKKCLDKIEINHIDFINFEKEYFDGFMDMIVEFATTVSSVSQNIYNIDSESGNYIRDLRAINDLFEELYDSLQFYIIYNENSGHMDDASRCKHFLILCEQRVRIIRALREVDIQSLKV